MEEKTLEAKLAEIGKGMATLHDYIDEKFAAKPGETAKLNESITKQITKFPWMSVVVGGAGAVAATELVDGFIPAGKPKYWNAGAKLTVALLGYWGLKKVKFVGQDGAIVFGAMTAFDGIRDLVPFDTYIQKGVSTLTGHPVTAGLAQGSRPLDAVNKQVNKVQRDYYSTAEGR